MEQGLKGIFALFGGLALFLYGMDALSRSLEKAAGQRMKRLLMVLAGCGFLTSFWLLVCDYVACWRGLRSRRCCKAARQSR